ncbi:MAG: hypothetical protein RLZZ375_190 [Pseudomonadota bacterium]|jgi:energy-coupling factor transporter ATP-binding protein EcfA2
MKSNVTAEMLRTVSEGLVSSDYQKVSLNQIPTTPLAHLQHPQPHSLHTNVPEMQEQISKLKSALSVLSSDVPRGQGKLYEAGESVPSEDYWLLVIWAIRSLNWTCGEEIARYWSKQSGRYTDEGFEQAWNSFDPDKPDKVGIGSLYKLAQAHGWTAPIIEGVLAPPIPVSDRFKVMWPADLANIQPIQWRLKHVLPATGIAAIYGPSGSGKSFITVDLGGAISHGRPWFGIKTHQTTVIYVVLEGEAGIRNRIQALEQAQGPLPRKGFGVITQPFEIIKPQDLIDLSAVIPFGSVVFIDTLNRAAPTADENSSRDIGEILEAAKTLYRATNSLVVLVHHTGKDASRGMRGHSSLFAAVDGAIEVSRNDTKRSWTVAKTKDGEDGKTVNFRLKRHVLGQDADGEDIVSCSVETDSSQVFVTREPSGAKQRLALAAIRRALASATNSGKCTAGTGTPCLTVTEAITTVAAELTTEPANKRNYKAKGLIDALLGGGFISSAIDAQGDGWVWKL